MLSYLRKMAGARVEHVKAEVDLDFLQVGLVLVCLMLSGSSLFSWW